METREIGRHHLEGIQPRPWAFILPIEAIRFETARSLWTVNQFIDGNPFHIGSDTQSERMNDKRGLLVQRDVKYRIGHRVLGVLRRRSIRFIYPDRLVEAMRRHHLTKFLNNIINCQRTEV